MSIPKTIAERMMVLIKSDKKYSQKKLALYIGANYNTVNNWFIRNSSIPAEYIFKIADYFNASAYELVTGEKERIPQLVTNESTLNMLDVFEQLPPEEQIKVTAFAQGILAAYTISNKENRNGTENRH